jgi:hypothetical protein
MDGDQEKGLSAAGARKIIRRCKKVRLIEPPTQYVVTDKRGNKHTGTFKTVATLCPKVKTSTLRRRLENGERSLDQLRREPQVRPRPRSRSR